VEFARQARAGDPLNSDTQVGPSATQDQYQKVLQYIERGKEEASLPT